MLEQLSIWFCQGVRPGYRVDMIFNVIVFVFWKIKKNFDNWLYFTLLSLTLLFKRVEHNSPDRKLRVVCVLHGCESLKEIWGVEYWRDVIF